MGSQDHRLVLWNLYIAFIALAIGGLIGLFQALEHAGISLYGLLPFLSSYYQGLSLHGVLNALVWTTFFICGFLIFTTTYSLKRSLASRNLGWGAFWLMVVGLLAAAWALLSNEATVLYTFYPPLKAHPAFYIGLTLVVVGTWLLSADLFLTYWRWRKENPGAPAPLMAMGSLVTFVLWDVATIGVAAEMLVLLIPWSLGVSDTTNPLLARTLFWFFGHPLVYFWVLPAYLSWYTMLPQQAGGRLFSDPMARLAFFLLLIFSIPVGLHHQFTDPGIDEGWKVFHTITTFAVAFPSLFTAFNVAASLEIAGRSRGGGGLLGWISKLPWGEPVVVAQLLALILFAFGGVGGIINASYNLDLVVHNTAWIVGHFHLTVGTAVTLTFMGISYWLLPYITGKALWSKKMALAQAYLWFVGMTLFSFGLHWGGLLGIPRRTSLSLVPYFQPEWRLPLALAMVGGIILAVSLLLYLVNIVLTLVASRQPTQVAAPIVEEAPAVEGAPGILYRWWPWLVVMVILVIIGYGPLLVQVALTTAWNAPGFRLW